MRRGSSGSTIRRASALALMTAVLLAFANALSSCASLLPLMGEGPPPGFTETAIPERYKGLRDPFSLEDQLAVGAGRDLYEANCAHCHGNDGKGEGPKAPYLEPRPANFAAPSMLRAFREHQDYVFWWVSEGVPKTSMPAWQNVMTDTERWQAITYAWYLGEQANKTARIYALLSDEP